MPCLIYNLLEYHFGFRYPEFFVQKQRGRQWLTMRKLLSDTCELRLSLWMHFLCCTSKSGTVDHDNLVLIGWFLIFHFDTLNNISLYYSWSVGAKVGQFMMMRTCISILVLMKKNFSILHSAFVGRNICRIMESQYRSHVSSCGNSCLSINVFQTQKHRTFPPVTFIYSLKSCAVYFDK